MKILDKLQNGATIIAMSDFIENRAIVLAVWGKEYVVWSCDPDGNCESGNYRPDIQSAIKRYEKRIEAQQEYGKWQHLPYDDCDLKHILLDDDCQV